MTRNTSKIIINFVIVFMFMNSFGSFEDSDEEARWQDYNREFTKFKNLYKSILTNEAELFEYVCQNSHNRLINNETIIDDYSTSE